MRTSLLCVLGALLLTAAFCSDVLGPSNCCFKVYPRKIKSDKIRSYNVTDERCARAGVIFKTKNNSSICVDPNMTWVQNIMKNLDENSL